MPVSLARLDDLVARVEGLVAVQTRRLAASPDDSLEAKRARRALVMLDLDFVAFRHSRDAIAEARRLTGWNEPEPQR